LTGLRWRTQDSERLFFHANCHYRPVTSILPIKPMTGARPIAPRQSAFSRRFWVALGAGRFETTFCLDCALPAFPPRFFCPHCWSQNIEWRALSGRGRLYSATKVHAAATAFAADAPYDLALVDLEEGVRVAMRLLDAKQTPLDSAIQLVVLAYEDGPLFAAKPVS
jgi:uncharacterized OB-fold protein